MINGKVENWLMAVELIHIARKAGWSKRRRQVLLQAIGYYRSALARQVKSERRPGSLLAFVETVFVDNLNPDGTPRPWAEGDDGLA